MTRLISTQRAYKFIESFLRLQKFSVFSKFSKNDIFLQKGRSKNPSKKSPKIVDFGHFLGIPKNPKKSRKIAKNLEKSRKKSVFFRINSVFFAKNCQIFDKKSTNFAKIHEIFQEK